MTAMELSHVELRAALMIAGKEIQVELRQKDIPAFYASRGPLRVRSAGEMNAVHATLRGVFCCIRYPDRSGYNTMRRIVFVAAAKALEWMEVTACRSAPAAASATIRR